MDQPIQVERRELDAGVAEPAPAQPIDRLVAVDARGVAAGGSRSGAEQHEVVEVGAGGEAAEGGPAAENKNVGEELL
jgi:hypothetical protein